MTILLIFLLITIIVIHSNLNSKKQEKQETVAQKDIKIMVPLKCLSNCNFLRTHEIPLINCEITLGLTCSRNVF